jgi:hypothetical protein
MLRYLNYPTMLCLTGHEHVIDRVGQMAPCWEDGNNRGMPATKKPLCNPGLSGLSVACSAGVAPANATPFGVPFGQSASY